MKNKLAIFDYCETLTVCQTANWFLVRYAYQNLGLTRRVKAWALTAMPVFSSVGYIKKSRKKWLLESLKGESRANIESFATKTFLPWLITKENRALQLELRRVQSLGYKTVILSGGLAVYIRAHNQSLGADLVIADELEFTNGVATGRILGRECLGLEKVNRLSKSLALDSFDLIHSRAYTDCLSDFPMLELVGEPFMVEKENFKALKI